MSDAVCPHLWEGSSYGTECCTLCGATVERKPTDFDEELKSAEHAVAALPEWKRVVLARAKRAEWSRN
jgi:hypothetical protein